MNSPEIAKLLPHPVPGTMPSRLLLFAIRRMAIGGLDDAQAANAFFMRFGLGFRRPLILLRATMAELSRVAQRRLSLAPCCCGRATADEIALLDAVTDAIPDARGAHDRLARTLAVHNCLGALTSAQALAAAFEDLGAPLRTEALQADQ